MAVLSHVSALLPFMGAIEPIVIWVTQKDKSQYVAFRALQALAYQLTMILAWFVGMGCCMCSFFGTFLILPSASSAGQGQTIGPGLGLAFVIPSLVIGTIFVDGFIFVIYGVVGAVTAFQGRPFRYTLIGIGKLDSLKKESERFRLIGSVFYLHAPEGVGRSKWEYRLLSQKDCPAD
jgi:uncharacterized Tic20 family protein